MDALELVNIICPEHTRTSCSDDNIDNGFYHKFVDTEDSTTIISKHHPRCSRCALLELINGLSVDENKIIETISIHFKH